MGRRRSGGPVDSPPTIFQDTALFGAADGYVYAVRAADWLVAQGKGMYDMQDVLGLR